MLEYAKFMKDLVMKKRTVRYEPVDNIHHSSAILTRSLVQKKADLGEFTIPCTIGSLDFDKALCDLRESINLMPLISYKRLGLGGLTPITMQLVIADRSVKRLVWILYDMLVKVANFIFSIDFVILDNKVDFEVPIILGRPFLATGSVLIDLRANKLLFRLNNEVVLFYVCQSMKQPKEMGIFSIIYVYYVDEHEDPIEEKIILETLVAVLMNFDCEGIEEYEETVCALTGMESYSYAPKKLDLDLKNWPTPLAKPSIKEPPVLALKEFPRHLRYVFLGSENTLPMIIAADLVEHQVEALIFVIRRYKRAICWTIIDIIGIPPSICTYKI
ncbi:uncharacterized protein LOC107879115 [Capsicum annuum]|uniref:uncharacterized protein LOC107879115 n=1 Tax=Capsicum annuum TaxID=4072 RepID=UPI0007BF65CC|nr:uncharacterized protein LOC107879115 [Capsicum annuum]